MMGVKTYLTLLCFIISVSSSHSIGPTKESAASAGQIKYAREQNYDDTGPGAKGPETAYAVYNNPEDAQLGYSDYSNSFEDETYTQSPVAPTTPRFWSQLSEQEYQSQSTFTPISNAIQTPVPKFYTNSQSESENLSIPSYYKMRPNFPYTSVLPFQLTRQQNLESYNQQGQGVSYERGPYAGSSSYRQFPTVAQFGGNSGNVYGLKDHQQDYLRGHGSYTSGQQPASYQRFATFPVRQHRFNLRPVNYPANQINRAYRVVPKYSSYD